MKQLKGILYEAAPPLRFALNSRRAAAGDIAGRER